VNCPKCGFEQEERVDCIRCGIVFSKYYAVHILSRSTPPDSTASSPDQVLPASDTGITEIRQTLREVQRRLGEVEYERAERAQLRKNLKALDERMAAEFEKVNDLLRALPAEPGTRQVQDAAPEPDRVAPIVREVTLLKERFSGEISLLGTRLEELQRAVAAIPEPQALPEVVTPEAFVELEQELKAIYLRPLRDRIDELEERLTRSAQERRATLDPRLDAALKLLEGRLANLGKRVAAISREREPSRVSEPLRLLEGRFADLEKRVVAIGREWGPSRIKVREALQLLEGRSADLEKRVVAISREWESSKMRVSEALQLLEGRFTDLEKRVVAITQEWESSRIAELLPRLEKGLGELEDLRGSLQSVSVRYSEIGELKKNHLVVLNNLDSVRMTLESFKRQIAEGFPRTLTELAREVAALRAEYRQIWQELHPSDSKLRSIP
jgi:hypothetical protein